MTQIEIYINNSKNRVDANIINTSSPQINSNTHQTLTNNTKVPFSITHKEIIIGDSMMSMNLIIPTQGQGSNLIKMNSVIRPKKITKDFKIGTLTKGK